MEKRVPESVLGREIGIEEEASITGKDVYIHDDSYMYVHFTLVSFNLLLCWGFI